MDWSFLWIGEGEEKKVNDQQVINYTGRKIGFFITDDDMSVGA